MRDIKDIGRLDADEDSLWNRGFGFHGELSSTDWPAAVSIDGGLS